MPLDDTAPFSVGINFPSDVVTVNSAPASGCFVILSSLRMISPPSFSFSKVTVITSCSLPVIYTVSGASLII